MTQISSSKLLSSALTALGAVAEVLVPGDDGYAGTAATLFADGTPDCCASKMEDRLPARPLHQQRLLKKVQMWWTRAGRIPLL